ncbi:MAG TPA: hypothetical protein VD996_06585 [Chitinophagaceae bacterium]|nr:hypothetical protein [Chitinophagaceae bacterium]
MVTENVGNLNESNMFILILSIFVLCAGAPQKKLTVDGVMRTIGQPVSGGRYLGAEVTRVSEEDIERHDGFFMDLTVIRPSQFTFLGLEVQELHLRVDSTQKVAAVYVVVENKDVAEKLNKKIGHYTSAMGFNISDDDPPSIYSWKYNKRCLNMKLHAYSMRAQVEPMPNTAFIIFNNCNARSYFQIPPESPEIP